MSHRKALLTILDGWGIGPNPEVDAIFQAKTPVYDRFIEQYPNARLTTFGEDVGLPDGQMGNSEVGHLNIGAGRIVYQELARINKAIRENTLGQMPAITQLIEYANEHSKPIHLMGLLSDGGVHSHIDHAIALCHILAKGGVKEIYIHAFMDGRDTDPRAGADYIRKLEEGIKGTNACLATVIGRYYAMDRDLRWERIRRAYDLLVSGKGKKYVDGITALKESYKEGITDEFIEPILIEEKGLIKKEDGVLFFNFRTDRPRQIVRALTQEDFEEHEMKALPLKMVTMLQYDQKFKDISVVYEKENLQHTLGEHLSAKGLSQVRIAETEKYPHVTFFFNGGREKPFEGEDRILIPSPKVATYDLAPEMSANEITNAICQRIEDNPPDFICLNYANADMVGHTGDFNAAISACETVDNCLGKLVDQALKADYEILVIADHGNSDIMKNEDGSPNTAHTTSPVPIIYISDNPGNRQLESGKLADIAPTILSLMGIAPPEAMTGQILVKNR